MYLLILNFTNTFGNVSRTAVLEVVAIDGRQHNVVETPRCDCLCGMRRFVGVERRWSSSRFDGTKATATSAGVSHQLVFKYLYLDKYCYDYRFANIYSMLTHMFHMALDQYTIYYSQLLLDNIKLDFTYYNTNL